MNYKPVFTKPANHPVSATLDLYSGLELHMSKPGAETLGVFLTPDSALLLAEHLIQQARKIIARQA